MTNSVVFTKHIHEYMIWLAIEYSSKYRCDTLNFDHIDAHTEHNKIHPNTAILHIPLIFFCRLLNDFFLVVSLTLCVCVHVFFILFVISFFVTFDYQWFMSFASSQLNAFHSMVYVSSEHTYKFTFTNRKIAKE